MKTKVIFVKPPGDDRVLLEAGRALREGAVVAFPTETVYGLGASALLPEAVLDIFRLKGRPADNPLIVHLLSADDLEGVVSDIPPVFQALYQAFSPGPLTFVMPRHPGLSPLVTGGLETVAVRFPAQPAARALLRASGVPIVAPSANLSGRPSPTRARHVLDDFAGRIPYVIDGGPSEVGLESTVLDLLSDPPRILRPGRVTAADIEEKTGIRVVRWEDQPRGDEESRPVSPGMKYRHYAPRAEVRIVLPQEDEEIAEAFLRVLEVMEGSPALFLSEESWDEIRARLSEGKKDVPLPPAYTYEGGRNLDRAGSHLFDGLRTLDEEGPSLILAEGFFGPESAAYMDRLTKASRMPALVRRVLFICEGNTCRSPMAEAIFNDRYRELGFWAESAGIGVIAGQTMAENALLALEEWGIDPGSRKSRQFRARMVREADLVVTMTGLQRDFLLQNVPGAKGRILSAADLTGQGDIRDPYGQPLHAYRRVRDQLGSLVHEIYDRLILTESK